MHKRLLLKNVLVMYMISSLAVPFSFAGEANTELGFSRDLMGSHTSYGNEFVSGDYPGVHLMRINLWGAVGKSGIHFVPPQTDLITLLSYAGGPSDSARLSDVFIKRWQGGKEILISVNMEDLIHATGKESPVLEANDVVVVPSKNR